MDRYEKTKNINQMIGNQPFVSTELHRFMTNMQDMPSGNQVHSPKHNRFDSIRDEEVYRSIGNAAYSGQNQHGTTSNSGWSRSAVTASSASMNLTQLKAKLQARTHGMTSEQHSFATTPGGRQNGGDIHGIINYDYEKDYVMEAMMQDKMLQNKKARKKSFDLRKTTKAHEGNLNMTKKRLEKI